MDLNVDLSVTCPIHSFETFGAVDGPGIRFVIFTQGCNLKCKYCQNRDTWNHKGGTLYTVAEVVNKIERYKNYIIPSGGGVTISGGEPLLHVKFLISLFKQLKKLNISTAIDTSGVFNITDEIKELEFAKYLSENNKDMWIRQVLVPGYTDKEEDLLKLKEFLSTLKTVKKVEILPYHDMGKFKWTNLGFDYPLEGIRVASNEDVDKAKKILKI